MRAVSKIIVLLCISASAIAQIGAKAQQQGKIFGLWQTSQFGYQMTLMLNPNGTGEFDGEAISFQTQGNALTITQGATSTRYNFTLQANSLTLSGGDLQAPVTFSRNGETPSATATTAGAGVKQQSTGASGGIVGTWSTNGETLEFREGGQCVYLGNTFTYQLGQGTVTLVTPQGNAAFQYAIQGNQLTLTGPGGSAVYTKGASQQTAGAVSGEKQVPQELVGEWMWISSNSYNQGSSQSSTFINLYANGTYKYTSSSSRDVNTSTFSAGTSGGDSDAGTWWVQGDRIFYNSQTKGQGSYRLQKQNHPKNGDAMIVIDGQPYVTSQNRPPWR